MAASSAGRLKAAREREGDAALERRARALPGPARLNVSAQGFDVIAEVKWRSPAEGELGSRDAVQTDAAQVEAAVAERARTYGMAGALALSVLTEPEAFQGELAHLASAAAATRAPVMRKDFLVDPYQIYEARVHGAAGVLLIVRMLDDERLAEMLSCAHGLGMFALIEAFDAADLARVGALLARYESPADLTLVGLNCRDLTTLQVDVKRFEQLADAFPEPYLRVAESGLTEPAGVAEVAHLGYGVALIGSALMRAADPGQALAAFLGQGREAAACGSA